MIEEIILLTAAAFGALQATHQEHRHAHRDQHGKNTSVRRKPMRYGLHFLVTIPERSGPSRKFALLNATGSADNLDDTRSSQVISCHLLSISVTKGIGFLLQKRE
jgi:hypothetical protein